MYEVKDRHVELESRRNDIICKDISNHSLFLLLLNDDLEIILRELKVKEDLIKEISPSLISFLYT